MTIRRQREQEYSNYIDSVYTIDVHQMVRALGMPPGTNFTSEEAIDSTLKLLKNAGYLRHYRNTIRKQQQQEQRIRYVDKNYIQL